MWGWEKERESESKGLFFLSPSISGLQKKDILVTIFTDGKWLIAGSANGQGASVIVHMFRAGGSLEEAVSERGRNPVTCGLYSSGEVSIWALGVWLRSTGHRCHGHAVVIGNPQRLGRDLRRGIWPISERDMIFLFCMQYMQWNTIWFGRVTIVLDAIESINICYYLCKRNPTAFIRKLSV